ncbi:MAG: VWA domain-containing protein [Haloferacaceae archaeon]
MSVEATLPNGVVAGVETPVAFALLPVIAVGLWALVRWRTDGSAGRRSRRLLLASRLVVATLVVVAVAGPYTVTTRETAGDPQVTLLVDRSDSMETLEDAEGLADRIEATGMPVTVAPVGNGTTSRPGDAIAANLREGGNLVVVSDGHVTEGRSLARAAELAASLNATVSSVRLDTTRTERHVTLSGPAKASAGVENRFLARVGGVETDEGPVDLTVTVDGETVVSRTLDDGSGNAEFSYTFNATGPHRVTARIGGADGTGDRFAANDVYRHTVRVVEQPRILYVSRGDYPLRDYLGDLYDVDTASSVPQNLDPYYAVVVQDLRAEDVGNVSALQEFVIDGNGLMVVGGRNSFENGGYEGSTFSSMLPVSVGEGGPGTARIVLAIDVSGSTQEGMEVQKAIALDVLDQLGDENEVGVVAFNYQPYAVAEPRPLGESRERVADRIRRLTSGGATSISSGLRGAQEMLGGPGTVILISDGRDSSSEVPPVASDLGASGIKVIAVGVGQRTQESTLRTIAEQSGGNFLRASETNRLRILFGGPSRQFQGEGLVVVNPNTFITAGVDLESNPGQANGVSVRRGANLLVASGAGDPAVATWRYGLGRVVTLTAYAPDGTLDGLLRRPDSLLVTKSTNWAIGDPQRKRSGVAEAADTRVGESTTVLYRGSEEPTGAGVDFRKVGEERYEATVTPDETGYHRVAGATYAANYPAEYGAFGQSSALSRLVRTTGGEQFGPGEAEAIARFAAEQAVAVREVRDAWDWLALLLALLLFLLEVAVRRLQVYRGRTRLESGLT